MRQWDERRDFLLEEAAFDQEFGVDVRPGFLAYAGSHPLFVAFLRPFLKGQHMDAVIELLALAAPLDADRLAVSIGARAWSLDDPIPPVIPGVGDLRQRVLVIEEVDGSTGRARGCSLAYPWSLEGGRVRWSDPLESTDVTGPLGQMLRVAVARRRELSADTASIREQAERCARLGHLIALAEPVNDRLLLNP